MLCYCGLFSCSLFCCGGQTWITWGNGKWWQVCIEWCYFSQAQRWGMASWYLILAAHRCKADTNTFVVPCRMPPPCHLFFSMKKCWCLMFLYFLPLDFFQLCIDAKILANTLAPPCHTQVDCCLFYFPYKIMLMLVVFVFYITWCFQLCTDAKKQHCCVALQNATSYFLSLGFSSCT